MVKRLLNVVLVMLIIILISVVFINFYNKSKLQTDKFTNSTNEKVKIDDTKNNSSSKSSTKNKKKDSTKNEEKKSDVSKKTNDENTTLDDTKTEETKTISNEVNVPSTSSSKNVYVFLVGSMIIMLGFSAILLNNRG